MRSTRQKLLHSSQATAPLIVAMIAASRKDSASLLIKSPVEYSQCTPRQELLSLKLVQSIQSIFSFSRAAPRWVAIKALNGTKMWHSWPFPPFLHKTHRNTCSHSFVGSSQFLNMHNIYVNICIIPCVGITFCEIFGHFPLPTVRWRCSCCLFLLPRPLSFSPLCFFLSMLRPVVERVTL